MLDFKAAIFDLDGTLIDSMGVWEKIDVDFLTKRHLNVPGTYLNEICSRSFQEAAEYTIALFDLKECPADVIAEWNRMAIDEYNYYIKLKPYAKEYLNFLKERNIMLGIATALPKVLYEPVLRNNDVYEFFDAFSSTDEVDCGKENPGVYLLTAKKLKVSPSDCIVFDDVLPAIKGIIAAGMQAYGVYDQCSAHEQEQMMKLTKGYIYGFDEML